MSDTGTSRVGERQSSGSVSIPSRQSRLTTALEVWFLWVIAAAGFVLAAYFYTHRGVWTTEAERWYIMIGGMASVVAIGYGAYRIYTRPRVSD